MGSETSLWGRKRFMGSETHNISVKISSTTLHTSDQLIGSETLPPTFRRVY